MRIHSNTLTRADILRAAPVGTGFIRANVVGSRTHDRAFDVALFGTSRYRAQADRDYFAATWDQWGIFLWELFQRDARTRTEHHPMRVPHMYEDQAHFRWATVDRFDGLTVRNQHPRHTWRYFEWLHRADYQMHDCKCGAATRRITDGSTWQQFADRHLIERP